MLEVHGNIWDVRCSDCGSTFDRTGVELEDLPSCPDCRKLLRPAVVWFGENLPEEVWAEALEAVTKCNLFLVVGTSALVYPAAGLIQVAKNAEAKVVEINLEPAAGGNIDLGLYGRSGGILPRLVREAFPSSAR